MAQRPDNSHDLSPNYHVARYCRPRDIADGIPRENAFILRSDETYLSTNWLEYFHESDRNVQIAGVNQALTDKRFRVANSGAFAVLNVGAAIVACWEERNLEIRFTRLGESGDPTHTGIFGYTVEDTDTAATLARQVREVYPATAFAQGS